MSNCPSCQRPLPPDQAFCGSCGARAGGAAASPAGPARSAEPAPSSGCRKPLGLGCGCLVVVLIGLGVAAVTTDLPRAVEEALSSATGGGAGAKKRPGALDPATAPLRVSRPEVQPLSSGALRQNIFRAEVENISHVGISAVKLTAVLFDGEGNRISGPGQEVGVAADVGDIEPGDTYELRFTVADERAYRAALVVREVVYTFVPEGKGMEMYRIAKTWTNPRFEEERAAASGR